MFHPQSAWLASARILAAGLLLLGLLAEAATACPFCVALTPTLTQRKAAAEIVALAEISRIDRERVTLEIRSAQKGAEQLPKDKTLTLAKSRISGAESLKTDEIVLLLATRMKSTGNETEDSKSPAKDEPANKAQAQKGHEDQGEFDWEILPLEEESLVYVARLPDLQTPSAERLKFFARQLSRSSSLVTEDAFAEFAFASYDQVLQIADEIPYQDLTALLVDPNTPERRKGFLGMALGVARQPEIRQRNLQLLTQLVDEPASDFRAGFDGILAGYLLLGGSQSLAHVSNKYFSNPDAKHGDVLHALAAVRFYHEFGTEIPKQDLAGSLVPLLDRGEFAAAVVVDLARYKYWECLAKVGSLYEGVGQQDRQIRRAVVGYLSSCPLDNAKAMLDALRKKDPQGVKDAEKLLKFPAQKS